MSITGPSSRRPVPSQADRGSGLTDGRLLTRFVSEHDEAAFAELVSRLGRSCSPPAAHGDRHAAEDAFQVTFVLARKAETIRPLEAVGGWVYRVARKAALRHSP